MSFFYDMNKRLQQVLETPKSEHKQLNEGAHTQGAMELNPDFKKVGQKPGIMGKIAKGAKRVADFVAPGDEDLVRDLERKTGGRRPRSMDEADMEEGNRFTGNLAKARAAGKKSADLDGDGDMEPVKEVTKEIPGGRRHTSEPGGYGRKDDDDAPKAVTKKGRGRPKKGSDSETGQVMKPDWSAFGVGGKVNLPKHKGAVTRHKMVGEGEADDVEAAIRMLKKAGYTVSKDKKELDEKAVSKSQRAAAGIARAAQKGEISKSELRGASKEMVKMPAGELKKFAKTKEKGLPEKKKPVKEIEELDELSKDTLQSYAKKASDQAKSFDAAHRSEKKRDAKVAKTGHKTGNFTWDKYDDRFKKYSDQRKGGIDKAVGRLAKDEVEETTVAGSVAPAAEAPNKSKGGINFGGSIYDSVNREVENLIAESMTRLDESMNISMNMNTDQHGGPSKSLTVTATDEDADKLAALLQMAGMGAQSPEAVYADSACQVDENQPENTPDPVAGDGEMYAGGLNKPKRDVAGDGQATGTITAVHAATEEDDEALRRIREMAGIRENKKPDFLDLDKDGDKSEPMKKAAAEKDEKKEEKVDESIFASTANLWKTYKG